MQHNSTETYATLTTPINIYLTQTVQVSTKYSLQPNF